jgi:hypothetical protein
MGAKDIKSSAPWLQRLESIVLFSLVLRVSARDRT